MAVRHSEDSIRRHHAAVLCLAAGQARPRMAIEQSESRDIAQPRWACGAAMVAVAPIRGRLSALLDIGHTTRWPPGVLPGMAHVSKSSYPQQLLSDQAKLASFARLCC